MPINARMAGGYKRSPIETSVDESPIMIPQLLNPKNAKKNPIPAPIPNFKSIGIRFNIFSLNRKW